MNNIEKWIPLNDIPEILYIDSIIDDYNGFRIIVTGEEKESKRFELNFENYYGYRNFNESERLRTLNDTPELTIKWSLFKAYNTDLIQWIVEESLGIVETSSVEHYVIATPDDILEVLSSSPPIVRVMN